MQGVERKTEVASTDSKPPRNGKSESNPAQMLLYLLSLLITIGICVGTVVAGYYKNRNEMDNRLNSIERSNDSAHADMSRKLELMSENIGNQLEWNAQSVELLSKEVPRAIRDHEYHMHPVEVKSSSSPTKIDIVLPKKPKPKEYLDLSDPTSELAPIGEQKAMFFAEIAPK